MGDEKRYIVSKLVTAKPMTKFEYSKYMQKTISKFTLISSYLKCISSDKEYNENGYLVKFNDEEHWIPKKDFDSMSLQLIDNKSLPSNINIDESMVDDFIDSIDNIELGRKTTLLKVVLKNGYEIVEYSGTVDESNYDPEICKKACMDKAKRRIWDYLGFLLQTAWKGIH